MFWEIEPRDPIIVGDGRPFGTGGRGESLQFPYPTTIAGVVRTRKAIVNREDFSDELLQIGIRGPLLKKEGEIFVAAPADAVIFGDDAPSCVKLMPKELPEGCYTNLPDGLLPVWMLERNSQKPSKKAPRYWRWSVVQKWLLGEELKCKDFKDFGTNGPERDLRTGVAIDSSTMAAIEGRLFQRCGLEFGDYSILLETQAELKEGFAPMGGDRRIVFWHKSGSVFPEPPKSLIEQICADKACRLVLLTPGFFNEGLKPSDLVGGVVERVVSIANGRYQVVSGWDLKKRRAKPSRRLVPAGSVYFLKLQGSSEEIHEWVKKTWFQNVSDGEQNRRDGLGLAALGVWKES